MEEIIRTKILKQDQDHYKVCLLNGMIITGRILKDYEGAVLIEEHDGLRTWVTMAHISALRQG